MNTAVPVSGNNGIGSDHKKVWYLTINMCCKCLNTWKGNKKIEQKTGRW